MVEYIKYRWKNSAKFISTLIFNDFLVGASTSSIRLSALRCSNVPTCVCYYFRTPPSITFLSGVPTFNKQTLLAKKLLPVTLYFLADNENHTDPENLSHGKARWQPYNLFTRTSNLVTQQPLVCVTFGIKQWKRNFNCLFIECKITMQILDTS